MKQPISAMTEVSIACPGYRCSNEVKGEGEKISEDLYPRGKTT